MGKAMKFLCEVEEVLDSNWSLVITGKVRIVLLEQHAKSSQNNNKKKRKKSVGFDDEIVLCGPVFDVVKYKDDKVREKEKLESAANVLRHRFEGDGGSFPGGWNALPERSMHEITFSWKVRSWSSRNQIHTWAENTRVEMCIFSGREDELFTRRARCLKWHKSHADQPSSHSKPAKRAAGGGS